MAAGPSYTAMPVVNIDATNGSDTAPPSWVQTDSSVPQSAEGPYTVGLVAASTFAFDDSSGTFSAAYPDGAYTDLAAFCGDPTAGAANFVQVLSVAKVANTVTATCDRAVPANWTTRSVYLGQQLTLASLSSTTSAKLLNNNGAAGDALAGWKIQFLSGHTETIAANTIFKRAGSAAAGAITLQGATAAYRSSTGAATTLVRPVITFSNNGDALTINNYCVVKDFDMTNSNGTKTAARAIVIGTSSNTPGQRISGMKITAFGRGITCDAGSPGALTIENCYIYALSGWTGIGYGILLGNNNGADYGVQGCWIDNITGSTGGTGIGVTSTVVSNSYMVEDTIVSNCVAVAGANGHGVHVSGVIAVQSWDIMNIRRCVFYANQGDGYRNVAATATPYAAAQSLVENCQFVSNAGYGINFSSTITAVVLNAVQFVSRNNNYYLNTLGTTNPASIDVNATAVNPQFRNAAAGDFRSIFTAGYPDSNVWITPTVSKPGVGIQNGGAGGGSGRTGWRVR